MHLWDIVEAPQVCRGVEETILSVGEGTTMSEGRMGARNEMGEDGGGKEKSCLQMLLGFYGFNHHMITHA